MGVATLRWNGAEVRRKIVAAAHVGVDTTMAAAVRHAAANHPGYPPASEPYERFHSRTGFEVGSIKIFDAASLRDPTVIAGQWGADASQSIYLEIGTSIAGPTAGARALAGAGDMSAIPPPIGPLMAPRPFLRPAADEEYPLLAARIGAVYRGESLA
jgi:hypothetical protein